MLPFLSLPVVVQHGFGIAVVFWRIDSKPVQGQSIVDAADIYTRKIPRTVNRHTDFSSCQKLIRVGFVVSIEHHRRLSDAA